MAERSEFDRIREEAEAKQRGTLWPDTLRSGRTVDEFLWKGDPRPTPVQRAGLAIFGLGSLTLASAAVALIVTQDNWYARGFGFVIGSLAATAGIRFIKNALRRIDHHGKNHDSSNRHEK